MGILPSEFLSIKKKSSKDHLQLLEKSLLIALRLSES